MTPPSEWPEVLLADVASDVSYGFTASATGDDIGPHFLRITDIVGGRIKWDKVPYCEISADDKVKYKLVEGDIVVARTGPVGESARVSGSYEAVFASYLVRVRLDPQQADSLFMSYMLRSPEWWAYVDGVKSGSVQPQFNASLMKGFRFRLPPLAIQRRVATVLGLIDDKIELSLSIALDLSEATQQLFELHFGRQIKGTLVRFDEDSLPQGWRAGILGDLVTTKYGHTASASNDPVGPRFLRVMDINKRPWINWAEVPYCEISGKQLPIYRLKAGDVVVARMADPGKAAVIDDGGEDAVFASYLVRLQAPNLATSYFVHGLVTSPAYQSYCASVMAGSAQKNINAKVMANAPIAIPPSSLLGEHLADVLPIRDRLRLAIDEVNDLETLRNSLLPAFTSGALLPQVDGSDGVRLSATA